MELKLMADSSRTAAKAAEVVDAMDAKFENKQSNKKNNISGDFSNDTASYPTVQAVKSELSNKVDKVTGKGLSTNDYTTTEKNKLAGIEAQANKYTHPTHTSKTSGLYKITVDGSGHVSAATAVAKSDITGLGIPASDTTYEEATTSDAGLMSASDKTKLDGIDTGANKTTVDSSLSSSSTNPVQNKVINTALSNKAASSHSHGDITSDGKLGSTSGKPLITGTNGKISAGSFGSTAGTFAEGNHTHSGYLTSHQSLDSKTVTLEKQATAESGFAATYVLKQGGTALSPKINIPKDYLLKSASMKTVGATATAIETANDLTTGDVYLEFVVNTTDSADPTYLLINVNDLLDDIQYTADNSTLQLSNSNQFSVKDGGITLTKLASGVQTSLGYADSWNSSVAKNITQSNINSWNGKSNITVSDVDTEIEAYLDAIVTALGS
ncbi:hypothetical protein [Methanobrevibacter sp.]|uniref:hypothetical protein n=1 Tax=Methanobrevibacter sp. TaxID=66852 RepID=UPI00386AEF4A